MFPVPKNFCSLVPLNFIFKCSLKGNIHDPLFPQTPGKASLKTSYIIHNPGIIEVKESAYSFACRKQGEDFIGCVVCVCGEVGGGGGGGCGRHQYPVSLEVNRRISIIPFIYSVRYLYF